MRNTSTTFFLVQDRICSSMSFFVMIICTFLLLFLSYTEAYDTLIQGQGGGEGGGSESSFFFFSKDRNNAGIEIWSRTFFVDLVLAFDGNAELYQSYLPSHMVFLTNIAARDPPLAQIRPICNLGFLYSYSLWQYALLWRFDDHSGQFPLCFSMSNILIGYKNHQQSHLHKSQYSLFPEK